MGECGPSTNTREAWAQTWHCREIKDPLLCEKGIQCQLHIGHQIRDVLKCITQQMQVKGQNRDWEQCLAKTMSMRRNSYHMLDTRKSSGGVGEKTILFYKDLSDILTKNRFHPAMPMGPGMSLRIHLQGPYRRRRGCREAPQHCSPHIGHSCSGPSSLSHLCAPLSGAEYAMPVPAQWPLHLCDAQDLQPLLLTFLLISETLYEDAMQPTMARFTPAPHHCDKDPGPREKQSPWCDGNGGKGQQGEPRSLQAIPCGLKPFSGHYDQKNPKGVGASGWGCFLPPHQPTLLC